MQMGFKEDTEKSLIDLGMGETGTDTSAWSSCRQTRLVARKRWSAT